MLGSRAPKLPGRFHDRGEAGEYKSWRVTLDESRARSGVDTLVMVWSKWIRWKFVSDEGEGLAW